MRVCEYDVLMSEDRHPQMKAVRTISSESFDKLNAPEKVCKFMETEYNMSRLAEEHVYVIGVTNDMHALGLFEVAHGSINGCHVRNREIFLRLLLFGASGFIMLHNHPSGDIAPSQCDFDLYKSVKSASDLMGISLLDNIIIGDGYFSFCEEKIM